MRVVYVLFVCLFVLSHLWNQYCFFFAGDFSFDILYIVDGIWELLATVHTTGLGQMVQSQKHNDYTAHSMVRWDCHSRLPVLLQCGLWFLYAWMGRPGTISNGHHYINDRCTDPNHTVHPFAHHTRCKALYEHAEFQSQPKLYMGSRAGPYQFLQLHYIRCAVAAICHRTSISFDQSSQQTDILYDGLDWLWQIMCP